MGENMNANNELLMYIYQNADMGLITTKKIISLIQKKDNKIKSDIEDLLKGYEHFLKESKCLLKKKKVKIKAENKLAVLTANTAIIKEISTDNTDTRVADILIRGLNLGEINITKKVSAIEKEQDKEIVGLAKNLEKFCKESIHRLKEYL